LAIDIDPVESFAVFLADNIRNPVWESMLRLHFVMDKAFYTAR